MAKQEKPYSRQQAFDMLVDTYEAALLRYTSRILNDQTLAQDVVQETFLKCFRSWDKELEPSARLATWLYRVAHNKAVDYLRKRSRRDRLHHDHAMEAPTAHAPDRGHSSRVSESAAKAVDAMRSLPLREQQLVILKIYEEKSYKEISEITGLSVGNVGYILHHAMKKMARTLQDTRAITLSHDGDDA